MPRELEDPQGEPVTSYLPCVSNAGVVVDEACFDVPAHAKQGRLRLVVDGDDWLRASPTDPHAPLGKALVVEVRDSAGTALAVADEAVRAAFTGSAVAGVWERIDPAPAYTWSNGRAIFASGSPFPAFTYRGKTFVPGQCNNSYVFPGVGLGIVVSEAKRVTDRMFTEAAKALAGQVAPDDLAMGRVFPSLTRIREVSAHVGAAVATVAFEEGLAGIERPRDVLALVKARQWEPRYETYAT